MTAIAEPIVSGEEVLSVCLWRTNWTRLITLWEMQELLSHTLHDAIALLERIRCRCELSRPTEGVLVRKLPALTVEEREELEQDLRPVERNLRAFGLATSGEALTEIRAELTNHRIFPDVTVLTVIDRIDGLHKTIRSEAKSMVLLHIPSEGARAFQYPIDGWDRVIDRWPDVKSDIEDSSKCLALDRFPAALFHILLVAEFGVIQVCNFFGKSGDRPGWACVERLQKVFEKPYNDRSPLEQQHGDFLKDSVHEMVVLKADRHKLMHVGNKGEWIVREVGIGLAPIFDTTS